MSSDAWRYVSYTVNGGIFSLHLFIIFGLAFLFISSIMEAISNPRRLRGDVYVYGVRNGETLNRTRWAGEIVKRG
jgi:hypothetical protein